MIDDKFRRSMALMCIQALERMTADELAKYGFDDQKRQEALRLYRQQLAEIEARMTTPPPIAVGLKTASLLGKVGYHG